MKNKYLALNPHFKFQTWENVLNVFQATELFNDSKSQDSSQNPTPSSVSIPPNHHDSMSEERFHINTQ